MTVPIVFGRLKLPPRNRRPRPRDTLDNLVHLTPTERVDGRPCVCDDCCRARPERRIMKIKQLAEVRESMRYLDRV